MVDVIQFSNTLSASDGGPARHAIEVNYALNKIGVRTQLIAMHRSSNSILPLYLERSDAPQLSPMEIKSAARASVLLPRFTAAHTWIIHGYYLGWIPIVAMVGVLLNKRLLVMPHGALTSYDRGRKKVRKLVFHVTAGWWLNRVSHFAVATQKEASELCAIPGVKHVNIVGAGAALPESPLEQHSVTETIRLLSMSRIAPKKRVDRAIRALAELRRMGADARLTIAGTGDPVLVESLHKLCDHEGVADITTFVGQVEGDLKRAIYAESDIFVLLSEDENFGIGLADALSMGLPAIVSDQVSAATGLPKAAVTVLSDTSAHSVASTVLSMSGDYAMRRSAALDAARAHFSWNAVAERWRSLIETGPEHDRAKS